MTALGAAANAVRFLVAELGALAAMALWPFAAFGNAVAIAVAVASVTAVVALWGAFVAPKATRRLADPARLLLELAIFAAATVAFAAAWATVAAIAYAVLAVGSALLVRALDA